MSLHQKRVTITAVDLSKATEQSVFVIHYEEDPPTKEECSSIGKACAAARPDIKHWSFITLKKCQTLTVEQLPKQPAPEAQKEQVIEIDEDGKVHGNITGPLREP